jgi:hypothetical protein
MTRSNMFTRSGRSNKALANQNEPASKSLAKSLKNLVTRFKLKDVLCVSGRRFKRRLLVKNRMEDVQFHDRRKVFQLSICFLPSVAH